jgi:hypothetical protein
MYKNHLVDCVVDKIYCQNKILVDPLLTLVPKKPHMSHVLCGYRLFFQSGSAFVINMLGTRSNLHREYVHLAFAKK